MRHIVGVGDMKVSSDPADVIVTHALGSCLGIVVHDPVARVGGMLHVMLPTSTINPDKARLNPYMFVDTGVPELFRQAYAAGASKARLIVKAAGGANTQEMVTDRFEIGKRNYVILKKILWKNGILMDAEDVGGHEPRTMYLDVGTGQVRLTVGREVKHL